MTIGIDLGTSALKLLLMDDAGSVLRTITEEYPISYPKPGWSEQNPSDWWDAVVRGMPKLLEGYDASDVAAIGCAGQMHGLVALDDADTVLRPAILWNDGRTGKEVEYLNTTIGRDTLGELTGNIAFAGFTAPKILWMRENEPELFERIARLMLPKDYIVYRLTGVHATDFSDASGTLLLDVANRRWSDRMCEICGVREDQLPKLYESWEVVGTLLPDAARALGLPEETLVCAGAGDNAAAAVGTGTVGDGQCNISIGSSGTIFISCDRFPDDPTHALHAFAHADGGWHLMGCMLSAAACNRWWEEDILGTRSYADEQAEITEDALGRNDAFFLPYLMGERSPINDTDARGTFTGLRLDTSRADMLQAVLEGVAFAIRDSLEVARGLGTDVARSNICGGGSQSALWKTIISNVLGISLDSTETEQGPGYGAAILAMVAAGRYPTVREAANALVRRTRSVDPDPEISSRYEDRYDRFRRIYPAMKDLFRTLNET